MTTTPLLLRAARFESTERTPIWIMRQAGRYLPEYRALREKVSFLELCRSPELVVEASLMPLKRFALDGAIVFSDILIPAEAMGCKIAFTDHGPSIQEPILTAKQVEQLIIPEPREKMPFVLESLKLLKAAVKNQQAVLGFAGAPFTLAAYMVEGKSSNTFSRLREMLYAEPELYASLATKLAKTVNAHLVAQLEAGADVVQIFDTWAGLLSLEEYERFALPYTRMALQGLEKRGVTIHYILGGNHLIDSMATAGASILGVDWRCSMADLAKRFAGKKILQGNLNPVLLFSKDPETLESSAKSILAAFPKRQGLIFNLGHGIHPLTPIDNVARLVDVVRKY